MSISIVQTKRGPREVYVCDQCRTNFIPHRAGYCSGRCAREADKARKAKASK